MKVRFWGVRGSLASPLVARQIQSKISAVVQRITAKDIESADTRERFISELPAWIFGTVGGNTPCVEVRGNDETEIILDAGTGIYGLGKSKNLPKNKNFNVFLSHFHWDHIQGLPFFDPIFDSEAKIYVYSALASAETLLRAQQTMPYFPAEMGDNVTFKTKSSGDTFSLGDFVVSLCKMTHPGDSHSFSFSENGRKLVYATDVELNRQDFEETAEHISVFKDADCIILDSQYTVNESHKKVNWGHSSFCYAVDFAARWNIKNLYLFHHEPSYDDKKLNSLEKSARWYAKNIVHSDVNIFLAKEGLEFEL